METPDNPFIAPVNIEVIQYFMHRVGYQGIVDKVSAFFRKFLAQPWQTMFKKYPSISPRLKEDYHFIKDDIPLLSVYTTRTVTVRGMLIPNAFLTKDIRATDDYKKIEPESHKEHSEVVDNDDDNKEEKKDKTKDDEIGSLENRKEKMQTPIPTTPRSPRINLSSDKNIDVSLCVGNGRCNNYAMFQSIPCSPECKIVGQILLDHPLSYDLTANVDVPAVGNVTVRWILIPNTLLTKDICATDDYKEYETVFLNVVVPVMTKEIHATADETPELIIEFKNVDKRVPTIFDRARMKATLNDMLNNQF
nr:hypothetical protein [Tanacetum cinerariifolium]